MENKLKQTLIDKAIAATEFSYVPYSNYKVGASLLAADGTIFTGCNIENAAYGPSICAERVAIFKAVSQGYLQFKAIVVATQNGGYPCGSCRQVIREFAPDITVIVTDFAGKNQTHTLSDLLPNSFGPEHLSSAQDSNA